MKLTYCIFALLFAVLFLSSCHSDPADNKEQEKNVPNALRDNKSSVALISKRGPENMVDDIYSDMLEKMPDLHKLEEDISNYNEAQTDSLRKFESYKDKSLSYYDAAKEHLNRIKDSTLKREMAQVVANSNARYTDKVALINKIIKAINNKESTLNDYHIALKLMVTLPVIEQYQTDMVPDKKILDTLLIKKQGLIDRTRKLTPKGH